MAKNTKITQATLDPKINDQLFLSTHNLIALVDKPETQGIDYKVDIPPQRALESVDDGFKISVRFEVTNLGGTIRIRLNNGMFYPLFIEGNILIEPAQINPNFYYEIIFNATDSIWEINQKSIAEESGGGNGSVVNPDEPPHATGPIDPATGWPSVTYGDLRQSVIDADMGMIIWKVDKTFPEWSATPGLTNDTTIEVAVYGNLTTYKIIGQKATGNSNTAWSLEKTITSIDDTQLLKAVHVGDFSIRADYANHATWWNGYVTTNVFESPTSNKVKNAVNSDKLSGYTHNSFVKNPIAGWLYMNFYGLIDVNQIRPGGSWWYQCGRWENQWWEVWAQRGLFQETLTSVKKQVGEELTTRAQKQSYIDIINKIKIKKVTYKTTSKDGKRDGEENKLALDFENSDSEIKSILKYQEYGKGTSEETYVYSESQLLYALLIEVKELREELNILKGGE